MAPVPDLLHAVRHESGLTQAEVAKRAGTSQAAIARYESGVSSPAVSTLERVMKAMGHTLTLGSSTGPAVDLSSPGAVLVRAHRKEILQRARAAGVTNVRLFGSCARGEESGDSDIDLLVAFDVSRGLLPIVELKAEFEALLGRQVDIAPIELLREAVAERALHEAVPL